MRALMAKEGFERRRGAFRIVDRDMHALVLDQDHVPRLVRVALGRGELGSEDGARAADGQQDRILPEVVQHRTGIFASASSTSDCKATSPTHAMRGITPHRATGVSGRRPPAAAQR
jgi:hypothetical protein